jgi:hypothetical protein
MSRRDPKDALHEYLAYILGSLGLVAVFCTEYRFHPDRKWRFDYAWPGLKIAIEYDGIMQRTVGHNSLGGILRDSEKINEAQRLGWRVFRANAKNVGDGTFFALIESVLAEEATVA